MKTRAKNKKMKTKTDQAPNESDGGNPQPGTSRDDDPGARSAPNAEDPDSHPSWADSPKDGDHHVYTYKDRERGRTCLKGFKNLYQSKQLCDVKIRVDGEVFECHKSHLAASSQYFLTMFTAGLSEQDKDEITINMIPASSMRSVIHYIYSGCCDLDMLNVQDILFASDYFQLLALKEGCEDYMVDHLDSSNILRAYFLAQKLNCTYLEEQAGSRLACDIIDVMKTDEFLTLLPDQLQDLLRYHGNEATEEELFTGALRWLDHDSDQRKEHIYDVFSKIRFVYIGNFFLFDMVMKNSLLTGDAKLKALLDEVIQYSMMKERWQEFDFILRPRLHETWDRCIIYTKTHSKKSSLTAFGNYPNADSWRLSDLDLAELPQAVANAMILGCDDNLFIAGGTDTREGGTSDKLFKWTSDPDDFHQRLMQIMATMCPMHQSRDYFSFAQVDKHLYAIGGRTMDTDMSASILTHVEYYDLYDDSWTVVHPLPKPLRCTCAVAFEGKLYVFGGEMGKSDSHGKIKPAIKKHYYVTKSALCYDPSKNTWTALPDMTHARAWAGCAILNKKIYVVGGGQGEDAVSGVSSKLSVCPLKSVEIYDPKTNTWDDGPELPVPLYGAGVLKYNDSIYVLGGSYQNEVSCSVYQLRTQTETWIQRHDIEGMNSTCIKPYVVPRCSFTVLDLVKAPASIDGDGKRIGHSHGRCSRSRSTSRRRMYRRTRSQSTSSSQSWCLRRWSRSRSQSPYLRRSRSRSPDFNPRGSPIHSPSPTFSDRGWVLMA